MGSKRNSARLLIAVGLVSGITALTANIATNTLPDAVRPYLWLAWPLFAILTVLGIVLTLIQNRVDAPTNPNNSQQHLMTSTPNITSGDLRKQLTERTSLSDLKGFCFTMGIDDEDFPTGKGDFIVALLKWLTDRGRLSEFVDLLRRDAPWVLR